jgi:hypothetical protein
MADQKASMCVKVDYDDKSFIFERQSHFATKEEVGRGSITHEGQALYDNIEITVLDHSRDNHMYIGDIETKEFIRVFELLGLEK